MSNHFVTVLGVIILMMMMMMMMMTMFVNHHYHSDYSSNDVNDSNMKIFEYFVCKNIHTTVFGFSTQI